MSNEYINFYYDPARQGYDTDTWSTLSGAPVIVSNKLRLKNSSIAHFADLLRGDITFKINVNAPIAGDSVTFGLAFKNDTETISFQITDNVLSAVVTTDDGTTTSTVIPWDTNWNNTDTAFRIKWEAGIVTFYIGGQFKAVFANTATNQNAVPDEPMYLYALSNSAAALLIKYIEVMGAQSAIMDID